MPVALINGIVAADDILAAAVDAADATSLSLPCTSKAGELNGSAPGAPGIQVTKEPIHGEFHFRTNLDGDLSSSFVMMKNPSDL
jgi:hypothetical protein